MNIYYLQTLPSGRLIIDCEKHKDAEVHDTKIASCWIMAKLAFGYPLTTLQTIMSHGG